VVDLDGPGYPGFWRAARRTTVLRGTSIAERGVARREADDFELSEKVRHLGTLFLAETLKSSKLSSRSRGE
jgi:hypothetical protein